MQRLDGDLAERVYGGRNRKQVVRVHQEQKVTAVEKILGGGTQ